MRLSLHTLILILSLAIISCSPTGPEGSAFLPAYTGHTAKYRYVDRAVRTITGILKDEVSGMPVCCASVELYTINNRSAALTSATTNARGKFNVVVSEGIYVLVITHNRYQKQEIPVEVHAWDVDLNDIKVSSF